MTESETPPRQTLLLCGQGVGSHRSPAYRLLSELGHALTTTHCDEEAVAQLGHTAIDLVVVDGDAEGEHRDFIDRIANCPPSGRRVHVAIFADRIDDYLSAVRRTVSPIRFHVLLKPLHMHGLLAVLRDMENGRSAAAQA